MLSSARLEDPYAERIDRALVAFGPYQDAVLTPTEIAVLELDLLHREGLIKPDGKHASVWRVTARGARELARLA